MATAMNSTLALNTSCPTPGWAEAIPSAEAAPRPAPRSPAAMPVPAQRPRPTTPRAAARTMPTCACTSASQQLDVLQQRLDTLLALLQRRRLDLDVAALHLALTLRIGQPIGQLSDDSAQFFRVVGKGGGGAQHG